MNLGGKQDLDGLLKSWPAPRRDGGSAPKPPGQADASEQDEERAWDERADAIVKAALEKKGASGEALDALLGAPALAPEPGESGVMLLAGDNKKMAQEKEPGASSLDEGASSRPPASTASPPTERKRTSLKEIAARASQSGRPSTPGTPPPPSVAPSRPAATPLPRPVEAAKDDSGVINLDVVRASVTAQQAAAAERAKPGQEGLFDDDKAAGPAASPAELPAAPRPTRVAVVAAKKSNSGAIAGAAIALLGIAAAFAIIHKKQPDVAPQATAVVADVRPASPASTNGAVVAAPQASAATTAVAAAEPAPTAGASAGPDAKPTEPGRVAVGPSAPAAVGTPVPSSKDAPADPRPATPSAPVAAGGPPGDLKSEMARAVGPIKDADKGAAVEAVPEPASGNAKNQNVPEQPSQGSAQAAIGAVVGGAKGCVAGADDISRAAVTFSSAGTVTSVTVTGWAAAHGKSACVQAALKGAKVGPFSKSSFTVNVPIRP